MKWTVIVSHSLGFRSDYEIEAKDYQDAEKEAKQRFLNDFCGGKISTWFRGVETVHSLHAFTINKDIKTYQQELSLKQIK